MSSPDIYSLRCWELSLLLNKASRILLLAALFFWERDLPKNIYSFSLKIMMIMMMIVAAAFFFWFSLYTVFTVRFVAFFVTVSLDDSSDDCNDDDVLYALSVPCKKNILYKKSVVIIGIFLYWEWLYFFVNIYREEKYKLRKRGPSCIYVHLFFTYYISFVHGPKILLTWDCKIWDSFL